MKKIGIIVAMSAEYQLVEALLEKRKETESCGLRFTGGRLGDKEIVLAQSGIGKVCAAVGVREMIGGFCPDAILNTGVAGGIDVSLQVMDIVVGKEVVYHDVWCGEGNEYGQVQGMPARFSADSVMYEAALQAKGEVQVKSGLICSGDRFITDSQELTEIKKHFPEGLAVDMESGAMAQVCHMYQIPFLSLRVISDTPGNTEDHAAQYRNFWTEAPMRSFEMLKQLIEAL